MGHGIMEGGGEGCCPVQFLNLDINTHCLYLSAKYPIFNQHQLPSRRAQAH